MSRSPLCCDCVAAIAANSLALGLLFASSVRALPDAALTVDWSGSPECPKPADLEAQTAHLLQPDFEPAATLRFEAHIAALPQGDYRLHLRTDTSESNHHAGHRRNFRPCASSWPRQADVWNAGSVCDAAHICISLHDAL